MGQINNFPTLLMYIRRTVRIRHIVSLAWPFLLPYTVYSAALVTAHNWLEPTGIRLVIPFLPLSTIGIAVSFYLGFKNNQAYERFWEARQIWGAIVNASRTWGNQVSNLVCVIMTDETASPSELQRARQELIYRHLAWTNSLRLHLRSGSRFGNHQRKKFPLQFVDPDESQRSILEAFLPTVDFPSINFEVNVPTQLVRLQGDHIRRLLEVGLLNDFSHMQMMETLEACYDGQGKCERIKNTPFPRQYASYSQIFTWLFVILLPIGLISEFVRLGHTFIWLAIPFSMLIAWVFMTMEMVGDNSEDPFEGFVHDVPMTSLCRVIEIDLRQILGEKDLPPQIEPVNDILM